jgi:hypothetical protein
MFYVPVDYVHQIDNLSKKLHAQFIMGFSHELPEYFGLLSTFGVMYDLSIIIK